MKVIFLSMLLCIGAFAHNTSDFQDKDIDLLIQVPVNLKRTWNVSNSQTGFTITVFNTDEEDEDDYIMAVGKIPLTSLSGEDFEDFIPVLMEELYNNFSSKECSYILDEVCCNVEKFEPLNTDADFSHRFRIHLYLEELEETVRMDIYLFQKNNHSCFIMTGGLNCNAPDDLDDFSEKVLNNVSFVKG